jgi:hypothetical protein
VPSFIKEHQSANPSQKNLFHFCMEDSKELYCQSLTKTTTSQNQNFYLSILQMKSSSTCLIPAFLCEGSFFYLYVESCNIPSFYQILDKTFLCFISID